MTALFSNVYQQFWIKTGSKTLAETCFFKPRFKPLLEETCQHCRPYTISYQSSIVSVCQSCTVFDILTLICQKLRRHVTLTTPTWEQFVIITRLTLLASTRAQNLRLYLSLKGYVSRQYLWTVRQGNGWTTTLLLEVFTQRNFVADFIRLKLNFIF